MSNKNNNPDNKAPNPGTNDALKAENEALKAELEAMKAQAEKDAAAKAELEALLTAGAEAPIKNEVSVEPDERVDIFVPKGYANDEPNLIISVNGVNFLLPRGKTSNVPKFIAEEFYRSQEAQEALDKRVDEMLEASK